MMLILDPNLDTLRLLGTKLGCTYRQVTLNKVEDNIGTDENSCPSDASAAVNGDWPPMVRCSHVADESNQLL